MPAFVMEKPACQFVRQDKENTLFFFKVMKKSI